MFLTNWPTGEYSLLAAFTKSQEIYAFTFYSVVSGFFSGCFYWFTCLIFTWYPALVRLVASVSPDVLLEM